MYVLRSPWILALLVGAAALAGPALGQDRADERQVRRLQLQLRQVQQQLQEALSSQARLESENQELGRQARDKAQQAGAASSALRQVDQKLQDTETARSELAASLAGVQQTLEQERKASADALAAKEAELAQAARTLREVRAGEEELQARFREQLRMVSACSEKNERLVKLGAELIDRYHDKGFKDVLRQREPVLGLSDVEMFNVLQDYRDRVDAGRFIPSVNQ
jgi:chromosome segregation ATPase